jgi:DNA-binding transcriptional ArsR family regulator
MDVFEVRAEPTRREILAQLRRSARSVNELAAALEISQPAASKHLKVLREAGFLSCTVAGQQRIYRLEPKMFKELDHWLAPYLRMWTRHLDALERHPDAKEKQDESRRLSNQPARGRERGSKR